MLVGGSGGAGAFWRGAGASSSTMGLLGGLVGDCDSWVMTIGVGVGVCCISESGGGSVMEAPGGIGASIGGEAMEPPQRS